jgi:hypothetical protein
VRIGCDAAAESVPAVTQGKGTIALENVALGFMFVFLFLADHARRERWNDYPAPTITSRKKGECDSSGQTDSHPDGASTFCGTRPSMNTPMSGLYRENREPGESRAIQAIIQGEQSEPMV